MKIFIKIKQKQNIFLTLDNFLLVVATTFFNAGFMALDLPWRSTHICRHTFATITLMTTKNLSAVQASLGHSDQKVTQRYAKTVALLSSETGEKAFSALFKNSRL